MADAHCATITSFLSSFATATPMPRRRLPLLSAVSIPSPSRLTTRKNHLRQKLLKSLTRPYPNTLFPQLPSPITVESSPGQEEEQQKEQRESLSSDQFVVEKQKEAEEIKIRASEPFEVARVFDGNAGKFSKNSVFKLGMWLIGAFVFQTICAVWVLRSADFDGENGNSNNEDKPKVFELGLNEHGKKKSKFSFKGNGDALLGNRGTGNGGILFVDESELGQKIAEIQAMAREARERERLELKTNDFGRYNDQDDHDHGIACSSIEKEVDGRLVRLKKWLKHSNENSLLLLVNYLNKDYSEVENGVDKVGLDVKKANGALMFKRKYKFRSPSIEASFKPKGFKGLKDRDVSEMEDKIPANEDGSIESDGADNEQLGDLPAADLKGNVSIILEKDTGSKLLKEESKSMGSSKKKLGDARRRRKVENELKAIKNDTSNGTLQGRRNKGPSVRRVNSKESGHPDIQNSQSSKKENLTTIATSIEHDMLNRNSIQMGSKVDGKRSLTNLVDKKSDPDQPGVWWLRLPYVLAILMRRGLDGEGSEGLYTLKRTSQASGSSSHTVVFEDRGDATNFCYLLQSFFQDVGGFSAEIVPLPIKDLSEAVNSHTMKVLVVKKGRLQLYAGQPLGDVEMSLQSLLGQI